MTFLLSVILTTGVNHRTINHDMLLKCFLIDRFKRKHPLKTYGTVDTRDVEVYIDNGKWVGSRLYVLLGKLMRMEKKMRKRELSL